MNDKAIAMLTNVSTKAKFFSDACSLVNSCFSFFCFLRLYQWPEGEVAFKSLDDFFLLDFSPDSCSVKVDRLKLYFTRSILKALS